MTDSTRNGHAPDPLPVLSPEHLADLRKSGLTDATIQAAGFSTLTDPNKIRKVLHWQRDATALGPCMVLPYRTPTGERTGYGRLKPSRPRKDSEGKTVKYEAPKKTTPRAYFPPRLTAEVLADPSVPIVITEGEKKACAAMQAGILSIGISGVWSWQQKRPDKQGPRVLIPDLAAVVWTGRIVFIVFDSDISDKVDVQWAEWHLAEALREQGATVKVVRLPAGPDGEKCGVDDYLVAHGRDAFCKALEAARPATRPEDARPEIIIGPIEHLCVEQAIDALAKGDRDLYQRGGQLVRVAHPARPVGLMHVEGGGGLKIELAPTANLRSRITRAAKIVKLVSGKKQGGTPEKVPTHPPQWLVYGVEAADRWPGIRPLEAVVTSPVFLADGTVLQRPGYHADCGLLYRPGADTYFVPVPERPTPADARKARDALIEVVENFPFQTSAHKSAWLAAILTPLAKFAFRGPSPLFLADANVRAAGKGMLLDSASIIVWGRDLARTSWTRDEDELRKCILAVALEGTPAILFDNIAGFFGGPSLDAALTTTTWQGRVLGKSQQPRLPLMTTWYATGNNVLIKADTARRICPIRLDSLEEKPEERDDFKHKDLPAWVRAERPRLLAAALTILSAFYRAGRPDQNLKPWGSFEAWTALVRNAIVWVGMADPGLTRESLAERADMEVEALRGLVAGWQEIDPDGKGITIGQALGMMMDCPTEYRTLREVLSDLFNLPPNKLPTSQRLGNTLRKFRGRNIGGLCLDSRDAHGGVQAWFVRPIGPGASGKPPDGPGDGGTGGTGGTSAPTYISREGGDNTISKKEEKTPTSPTSPTTTGTLHDGTSVHYVADAAGLDAAITALNDTVRVGLDTETTGLDPRTDRVRLLSLTADTIDGGTAVYVIDCFRIDPSPLWEQLADVPIVAHNAVFDLGFLAALGFTPGTVHDTMLLSQLLHGTRRPKGFHGLEQTAEREIGRPLDKTERLSDWSARELTPEQLRYAAADAAVLPPLFADLTEKLRAAGMVHVAAIESECLPAMSWLCRSGVLIDRPAWEALADDARRTAEDLAAKLAEAAPPMAGSLLGGDGWNWDSPVQVKEVFAALGVTLDSTDDDALAAVSHPIAGLIREYRAAGKLASTYGRKWLDHVAADGRVYAGWRQIGADSGRMACASPNLQNLPRDPRYRRCFIAPPGRVLVKADYSQIELRIAAKVAKEKVMLDAYNRGDDLHTATARRVLNVEEVTKPQRQLAKAVNFGLLYGMGAKGFRAYAQTQYGVEMTEKEAGKYRQVFFTAYPGLARWHRQVRAAGAKESRTLAGRRRLFDDKTPDTQRLNTPVQGTGADGLKQAMALLWERRGECPDAFPVLVVHDEIVVECDANQADAVKAWLTKAMVDGMAPLVMPVPVEVEATAGQTWGGD